MANSVKLVILDWDGTVSDSISRIVTCLQTSASEMGLTPPGAEEGREVIGLGLPEALLHLFPDVTPGVLEDLRQCYSRHYVELDSVPPPFYPGVIETLEAIKNRGLHLAVATGKSRRGLDRVLGRHDLAGYFASTRCADETASKPHPLMLHEILEELGAMPEEAVMVGDTEFDMDMARRARIRRVGVSYGAHHISRLQKYELSSAIDSFEELVDLI